MEGPKEANSNSTIIYSRISGLTDKDVPLTALEMEGHKEANSNNTNIYSRISKLTDEDVSITALENASLLYILFLQCRRDFNMGYVEHWRSIASVLNDMLPVTVVGSTAEGVPVLGRSDVDIMFSKESDICCDEDCISEIKNRSDYSKVLIAHRQHASPGYALVLDLTKYFEKHENYEEFKPEIDKLVSDGKVESIAVNKEHFVREGVTIHGPAHQLDVLEMNVPIFSKIISDVSKHFDAPKLKEGDMVFAVPFRCKKVLSDWFSRNRMQGWPPEKLRREISKMQGHIVPVGRKGSRFEKYEWRICNTEAEITLVHSLNDVHIMLYYKLKIFSKSVLEGFCITSYDIKNVIFWLAESVPNKYFQHKYFIPLFRATLVCLRKFVKNKYLPNYMIPERNLFAGKFERQEQVALTEVLSYWIEKCPILEEEKEEIIPLYKDVALRNTAKFTCSAQLQVFRCARFLLSKIRKNIQAVVLEGNDGEEALAGMQRLFGLTGSEIFEQSKCSENDAFGTMNALFKTLTYIVNISEMRVQGITEFKSIEEPELD